MMPRLRPDEGHCSAATQDTPRTARRRARPVRRVEAIEGRAGQPPRTTRGEQPAGVSLLLLQARDRRKPKGWSDSYSMDNGLMANGDG